MPSKSQIEITLSRANTQMVTMIAEILKLSKEEIISFCLRGSTNLKQ